MPVVINGKIEIQDIMNTTQTGDHRFGDATIFRPLHRLFKGYMEDPENFKHEDYPENVHWKEVSLLKKN